MSELERIQLKTDRREASALLAVESPSLLDQLDVDGAWWSCHDEGDIGAMVSLLSVKDEVWTITSVDLDDSTEGGSSRTSRPWTSRAMRTDAEALARIGDTIFVFGSNFTDKSGDIDERRAFVARFSEREAAAGRSVADVLDLETVLRDKISAGLAGIELMPSDDDEEVINVEGAAFLGRDLLLGLRWPVSTDGQPILVRLKDAAVGFADASFTNSSASRSRLKDVDAIPIIVDVGATAKRPAGVRGMTAVGETIHLVTGQTERKLTEKKTKAAPALHVAVSPTLDGNRSSATVLQTFEGFRKVEGVAPLSDGRWLYALDDEDAVVVLIGQAS